MLTFIVWRLIRPLCAFFAVGLITFSLMYLAPGSPWDRSPGCGDPAATRLLNTMFRLNWPAFNCIRYLKPLSLDIHTCFVSPARTQFFAYMFYAYTDDGRIEPGALFGNFGPSYRVRGRTVQDILLGAPLKPSLWNGPLDRSARLLLLALVFSLPGGLWLGVTAGQHPGTIVDALGRFVAWLGGSTPVIVTAFATLLVFGVWLHWLPGAKAYWERPADLILPALALCVAPLAYVTGTARAATRDVLSRDYVRTARGMGLPELSIWRHHVLPNVLAAVLADLSPMLASTIAASVLVEAILGFPGMGRQFAVSLQQRDYPMIMGVTLLYAAVAALMRSGVELVHAWAEPRIRSSGSRTSAGTPPAAL